MAENKSSLDRLRADFVSALDAITANDHHARGLRAGFKLAIQAVDEEVARLSADDRTLFVTEQLEEAVANLGATKQGEK